jgi:Flp pilus assembly protein TadG
VQQHNHGQQELNGRTLTMALHGRFTARSGRRGQALAEFAITFPIFILLVVAAVDIGRGVFAYNSITNGAREGARLAIVNQDVALIRDRARIETFVADEPAANAANCPAGNGTSICVKFYKSGPNADPVQNPVCSPVTSGCVAVVVLKSVYQPITPIIRNILFPSGVTLTATSSEVVEFTCPNANTPISTNCPRQP